MVKEERSILKSRSFHFRKLFDINPAKLFQENESGKEEPDEKMQSRSQGASSEAQQKQLGSVLEVSTDKDPVSRSSNEGATSGSGSSRKERKNLPSCFWGRTCQVVVRAFLCSSPVKRRHKSCSFCIWRTIQVRANGSREEGKVEEGNWLAFISYRLYSRISPFSTKRKGWNNYGDMVTQQRKDLLSIPALRKLDTMLLDVGLSILKSYSRVLESLANTVTSCIEDVLYADSQAQDPSSLASMDSTPSPTLSCSEEDSEKLSSATETPSSLKVSDFMGWNVETPEKGIRKHNSVGNLEAYVREEEE